MPWTEQPADNTRIRTRSPRRDLLVGGLVGGVAVVVLVAFGRTVAATVLAVVVVGLTATRLLSPAVDARARRVLHRVATLVGLVLNGVLLGAVMVLVLMPVWLVSQVGRWDTLRPGGAPPGRWQVLRRRPWDQVGSLAFVRDPRPTGARRLHGAAVVAVPLALVLLALGPLRSTIEAPFDTDTDTDAGDGSAAGGSGGPDSSVPDGGAWVVSGNAPSRDGDPLLAERGPWAAEALATHVEIPVYDPNLVVRIRDVSTPYLNMHDRVRQSYAPDLSGGALDVWFFGSSALYGPSLIRDDHTIASEIVRLAEADGVPVRASNFAVSGYETWQEVMLLGQMLTERPDPDLVVFYGGYNDLHNYVLPGAPTQVSSAWAGDVSRALEEAGASILPLDEDAAPRTEGWSPENAAGIYDRGIELATDILGARGIPFRNYLQPSLWTRERPEDVATLEGVGSDEEYRASYRLVYDAARAAITAEVVDLSDALDDVAGVVYWDEVHHNEAANATVAAVAYETLGPELLTLWDAEQR